ncbi:DUF2922 domain-containing protein [Clostridium sp.]|uniref:DUF2922 domain-containing protein n=1 Tax=Clostridium sp. TaxID=1506 RepID=UPI003F8011AD
MNYSLQMIFETAAGDQVTYSISDVKTSVTKEEISNLMDFILTNKAITTKKGEIAKKVKATVITKSATNYSFE